MLFLREGIQAFQQRLREACTLDDGQLQRFGFQVGEVHSRHSTAWIGGCPASAAPCEADALPASRSGRPRGSAAHPPGSSWHNARPPNIVFITESRPLSPYSRDNAAGPPRPYPPIPGIMPPARRAPIPSHAAHLPPTRYGAGVGPAAGASTVGAAALIRASSSSRAPRHLPSLSDHGGRTRGTTHGRGSLPPDHGPGRARASSDRKPGQRSKHRGERPWARRSAQAARRG